MAMSPNDRKELQAMLSELATVGRENQSSDRPKLTIKDGVSAVYQSLGIVAILLGLVIFILSLKADVAANREAVIQSRADISAVRVTMDAQAERLRLIELKLAKMEK